MVDYLNTIIARKKLEVAKKKQSRSFMKQLKAEGLSVIAEIKRRSPSKGSIGKIEDPVALARTYVEGGADALSVLTDAPDFGGSLEDLRKVAQEMGGVLILQKDFIVDLFQLQEAKKLGADVVLLIVAVLGNKTDRFLTAAKTLGLEALVEVHNSMELEIALKAGAEIIGVNNRDLHTFYVDLAISERLASLIPSHCLKIAASGIQTVEDAKRMQRAGYDAVLVGEALVRSPDPATLIAEMKSCGR